ncbi:MAG TPA: hypothetical protein VMV96_03615 [Acidimicrobiales bacterium]|nr:hypothetical protein [Acidimicrobiales bacterium]
MNKVSDVLLDHEESVADRIRRELLSEVEELRLRMEDETTYARRGSY